MVTEKCIALAWTPLSKRKLEVTDGEEGKEKLFSILSPSV